MVKTQSKNWKKRRAKTEFPVVPIQENCLKQTHHFEMIATHHPPLSILHGFIEPKSKGGFCAEAFGRRPSSQVCISHDFYGEVSLKF